MRLLIILLFFSSYLAVLSQDINQAFIEADSGKYYISVYLNVYDLKRSNYEVDDKGADLSDINSLKKVKFKNARNGYKFFALKKRHSKVWYNTKRESLVGDLKSMNISNGKILVAMSGKNGNFIRIRIFKNENDDIVATIKEIQKNGKVNVYFSENCELNRYSI